MRFKNEIFEYWRKFEDELVYFNHRKENKEVLTEFDLPFMGGMTLDQFNTFLHTFRWLFSCVRKLPVSDDMVRPSRLQLEQAIRYISSQGTDLLIHAKEHKNIELRRSLVKKARKKIACAEYYMNLINQGFFDTQLETT